MAENGSPVIDTADDDALIAAVHRLVAALDAAVPADLPDPKDTA
jgi:hypothetical protein